jgi:hypothetical protein
MANESVSYKNERISEVDDAANSTENSEVKPTEKIETENKSDNSSKRDLIRMVGYPLTIGSLLGLGGSMLASKLNKNKKVFAIAGILVGVGLGYTLFLNYEKKNLGK